MLHGLQEPFNHRLQFPYHQQTFWEREKEKQRKKRLALAFSQPCAGLHSSIVSAGWEVMKSNVVAFHTILPQYAPFCLSILISSGTLQSSRRPLLVRLLQGNWPCLHFGCHLRASVSPFVLLACGHCTQRWVSEWRFPLSPLWTLNIFMLSYSLFPFRITQYPDF